MNLPANFGAGASSAAAGLNDAIRAGERARRAERDRLNAIFRRLAADLGRPTRELRQLAILMGVALDSGRLDVADILDEFDRKGL